MPRSARRRVTVEDEEEEGARVRARKDIRVVEVVRVMDCVMVGRVMAVVDLDRVMVKQFEYAEIFCVCFWILAGKVNRLGMLRVV